ncbi:MAG: NB-ARC domain-containing protein [Eubacteriales bacterium]|nr:NB-ARC domain-containing protein [Eubacteriales bacterium]
MIEWDFKENAYIDGLIESLINKPDKASNIVIGIDGMCGSGKTSLAAYIAKKFSAAIVHMDDFFLPPELRTAERLALPGGNVHYERFIDEVGKYIKSSKGEISYRRFNCSLMGYDNKPISIGPSDIYIVEGSYSMRPELCDYYDLKIFMKCSSEDQESRIIARNGKERFEMFRTRWIPMEEKYFSELNIEKEADWLIVT